MKKTLLLIMALNIMGFANAQNPKKLNDMFIIVLDVQNGYTQKDKFKASATQMIDSINYIIENIDTNKVVYIKTSHKLLNLSLSRPFIYTTIDSSSIWNIDSRINIVNNNILVKEKSDAFTIQKLKCILEQNNVKKIVILGLLAEQCVFETLMRGKELGYEMFVVPEAIIGKSEKSKIKMIRYFKKEGVNILHIK